MTTETQRLGDRKIIIIGFMGAGKTTVARELASQLNVSAADLDERVTEHTQRTPGEIISSEGEASFRAVETACLREVLNDDRVRVIALGGGAWTQDENRRLIAQANGLTVWLNAGFELCWQRIQSGSESRPLASSRAAAEELYSQRLADYATTAIRVDVGRSTTPVETAGRIIETILLDP